MSGMLRANQTGGSAGKRARHVRSFSVSDESSSGYEEGKSSSPPILVS